MAENNGIKGKVVIVTGSSSGIGAATAIEFARLGANVVVNGRNVDRVKSIAQQCRSISGSDQNALEIVADITVKKDIKRLIDETVSNFGKLDVLVNNAGIGRVTDIEDDNCVETYESVMNTNTTAVVMLCHYAVPHLKKTKGNIVSVSSVASTKPHSNLFAYCMAKSAVDMLTKCLAIDLGNKGIRVNAVNPAVIKTAIFSGFGLNEEKTVNFVYKEAEDNYPLQRPGEPQEVANAVAFLASDKSSFISGATLEVDGGSMWTSRGVRIT